MRIWRQGSSYQEWIIRKNRFQLSPVIYIKKDYHASGALRANYGLLSSKIAVFK